MRRWLVLSVCLLMLLGIGTGQAWSVFVGPLRSAYRLTSLQSQLVFTTFTLVFCVWIVVAGRLHDRFGPRPVAFGGALLIGLAYLVTFCRGASFPFLWLGMGLLSGMGIATVYTCPIATAIKWFPRHRGLMAGLTAAAFGLGPILVQRIVVPLLERGWPVLRTIGLLGTIYVPALLVLSLLLLTPPAAPAHRAAVAGFRGRVLLRDARFWMLFVGMLCGTFPYLLLIGNIRPIAFTWRVGAAVGLAIPALALGNAAGRVFWGALLLVTPAVPAARRARARFRVRALLADPRFWPLFVGMLCGTLPYLVLIGNIRPIAAAWQVGAAVGLAIPALALGNAAGRVFWGAVVDRAGTRATVRAAQITAVVAVALVPFTGGRAWLFLPALAGVGFCYGSNFAIYPATIARVYGVEWLGSVYPWIMLAQGVSSFGPTIAGFLNDRTGRLTCGMALAAAVAVIGLVSGILLGRRQREP